ncbi:ras-related protein RABC2b isoform X2 [Hevea brasiliensis]|uniref:ras-related protein RABC2b isoform X2 n=1 Tax=Hevea brasiliensis TaxID=3981 RepID=UPI0025FE5BB4|nr:ras-related protein RABC2b isoform X2 [Hevea brasiliensis]
MGTPSDQSIKYDYSFKIVMIGDSGVGKSTLLLSFITGAVTDLPNTIGVDMKMKHIKVGGKNLKLTIWDTVYDVTQRQTFTNLANLWAKEVELYSTNKDCVKLLVGNKVDKESERVVSSEEGMELAKQHGFLFLEASAKTRENVEKCFQDLALKMLQDLEKKRQEESEKKRQEELEKKRQEELKSKPQPQRAETKPEPPNVEIKRPTYPGPPGGGGGRGRGRGRGGGCGGGSCP